MFKIWQLPVRIRIIVASVFYRHNRYSLSEIIQNIFDSHRVRTIELSGAIAKRNRMEVLSDAVRDVRSLRGDIAEFGVFQGESLSWIARHATPDSRIFGFDSFDGLPECWDSLLPKGYFATKVPKFIQPNVALIIGIFERTIPKFLTEKEPNFSLVHIDCDLYSATAFILENVLDHVLPGGIIIFDEYYGFPGFQKYEYKAWHEALRVKNRKAKPLYYSSHSCAFILLTD